MVMVLRDGIRGMDGVGLWLDRGLGVRFLWKCFHAYILVMISISKSKRNLMQSQSLITRFASGIIGQRARGQLSIDWLVAPKHYMVVDVVSGL